MYNPYTFSYNLNESFAVNFTHWYQLNTEERSAYREKQYNPKEALKVFRDMYGEFEDILDNG